MTALAAVALVVGLAAIGLAGVRWLRVSQREHYLAGSTTRFALRWWLGFPPNVVLLAAAVLGAVLSPITPAAALVGAAAIAAGPFGLSLKGRTSKLAWTRRLKTLAAVSAAFALLLPAGGLAFGGLRGGAVLAALSALLVPVWVDVACVVLTPVERSKAGVFVDQAKAKLTEVHPDVVALTGSYGKTSTKAYITHLVGPARTVVPSPASFNNLAGLSRAVNENLTPGTEVFVAEMGTYGKGEIAELVAWLRPRVAAITAIGPVHLERFKTEDAIVEAKSEIFATAEVAILNVDDARLRALAERMAAAGKRVVTCSATDDSADVCVTSAGEVFVNGMVAGDAGPIDAPPTNVAVAAAFALELGVPAADIVARIPSLPTPPNRLAVTTGATGATILDDTYNSNPAGAAAALAALVREADKAGRADGKRIVVTPGMVELGPRQDEENARFGAAAAEAATHLVVVGRTNQRALERGVASLQKGPSAAQVVRMPTREAAVAWVRERVGPGDVVLYENDLPDHFP